MYKVYITERAEQDLWDNASYIKNVLHSPTAATNLINDFDASLKRLATIPKQLPKVHQELLKQLGIRYYQVKNYTIFFTILEPEKKVIVLRFLYSKRNWKALLGEDFLPPGSN